MRRGVRAPLWALLLAACFHAAAVADHSVFSPPLTSYALGNQCGGLPLPCRLTMEDPDPDLMDYWTAAGPPTYVCGVVAELIVSFARETSSSGDVLDEEKEPHPTGQAHAILSFIIEETRPLHGKDTEYDIFGMSDADLAVAFSQLNWIPVHDTRA